jgi:hypothetical protein
MLTRADPTLDRPMTCSSTLLRYCGFFLRQQARMWCEADHQLLLPESAAPEQSHWVSVKSVG